VVCCACRVCVDGKLTMHPYRLSCLFWQPSSRPRVRYINKQRVLVFCSRGVTSRFRHLMEDLRNLIPHHKKDAKVGAVCALLQLVRCGLTHLHCVGGPGSCFWGGQLDSKDDLTVINEVAEMKRCNTTVFFEVRTTLGNDHVRTRC